MPNVSYIYLLYDVTINEEVFDKVLLIVIAIGSIETSLWDEFYALFDTRRCMVLV